VTVVFIPTPGDDFFRRFVVVIIIIIIIGVVALASIKIIRDGPIRADEREKTPIGDRRPV